jgi:hypothetical protein
VDELDLGSAADVYGVSAAYQVHIVFQPAAEGDMPLAFNVFAIAFNELPPAASSKMRRTVSASLRLTRNRTGSPSRVLSHLRVNQQSPSEIKLDDTEAIEDMATRGVHVGADSFIAVRSRLLDGFHAPDWRSAA